MNRYNSPPKKEYVGSVKCIDTGGSYHLLTLGKVYHDAIRFPDGYIGVVADNNDYQNFKAKRFLIINEDREDKISKLLQ
jgi:hypothetical protein